MMREKREGRFIDQCLTCERLLPSPRYSIAVLLPRKGTDVLMDGHLCETCAPKVTKHLTRYFGARNLQDAADR